MTAPVVFAPCSEPVLYGPDFVRLNALAGGNPDFEPLVIKAAYVFGTALDVFESVTVLLARERAWQVTYRSAFGVFASAVELLGRCMSGNDTPTGKSDLADGLRFVFPTGLATPATRYSCDHLEQLRHFAAHGQGASKMHDIDYQVLERCPRPFGEAIEGYWASLQLDPKVCGQLARARITPLQPSRVESVWQQFAVGKSAGELFYSYNWSIRQP